MCVSDVLVRWPSVLWLACVGAWLAPAAARAELPQVTVLDPRWTLELVVEHPDLVTPTGLTFDDRGRLLVVECHTHFRPDDYDGPPADRILLVDDASGDGRGDGLHVWFEGSEATMGILGGPDGWVYVATRSEIFRLRESGDGGRANEREELARLETPGNYPHNGLCGLAWDHQGRLCFGLGENLGEPYRLVARDGTTLSGQGEGGNIFRMTADGGQLERWATGFWNPFGIWVDEHGRMFTVDNDPDGRPPSRLVHVVPGGDYGYQYRYGRSGRHPLQAWDGEFPGTLPMLSGTGEAPSAVLPVDGALWVSSWGDYRIERYRLEPAGATFRAVRETVVEGGPDFRPVDFAVAPDGSLYFTDWVDQSYTLHQKGRLWRLRPTGEAPVEQQLPAPSDEQLRAARLARETDLETLVEALADADPFVRQSAVWALSGSERLGQIALEALAEPAQRLGLLQAHHWLHLDRSEVDPRFVELLEAALDDASPDVRLFAVRSVADFRLEQLRPAVERLLHDETLTSPLLMGTLAALDWLERRDGRPARQRLRQLVRDGQRPAAVRAVALRMLGEQQLAPDAPQQRLALLTDWIRSQPDPLRREAVRLAALSDEPRYHPLLAELAEDESLPESLRADAVMGLAYDAADHRRLLERLAHRPAGPLAHEAAGVLAWLDQVPPPTGKPADDDLVAWLAALDDPGDADAGFRLFFGARGAQCANCHRWDGRGALVGPDLTGIGQRLERDRLLVSILDPSREVAPHFVAWILEMNDGRVLVGMPVDRFDGERREHFIATDGTPFDLDVADIRARRPSTASVMPDGLLDRLSIDEVRDLVALLETGGDP